MAVPPENGPAQGMFGVESGRSIEHNRTMQSYWVAFERLPHPTVLNLGAGVTARSDEDARQIATSAFPEAKIVSVTVVDDAASLNQGHVVPNMGSILVRGVWFPLGYEAVAAKVR